MSDTKGQSFEKTWDSLFEWEKGSGNQGSLMLKSGSSSAGTLTYLYSPRHCWYPPQSDTNEQIHFLLIAGGTSLALGRTVQGSWYIKMDAFRVLYLALRYIRRGSR